MEVMRQYSFKPRGRVHLYRFLPNKETLLPVYVTEGCERGRHQFAVGTVNQSHSLVPVLGQQVRNEDHIF